jgi:type 1 glutamine amidotransferase
MTLLKVAVITGGHSFDLIEFHELFRSYAGLDVYIQHLEDFCSSPQAVRDSYDALVFYFMPREGPTDEGKPKSALEHLAETGQGLVILHHAILAYPDWPLWTELVGLEDTHTFDYYHDQKMNVCPTDVEHPITAGLSPWTIVDETYDMGDTGEGSEILLTTDHPKSMKTIGWTRAFGKSRVFCCELGHDHVAWQEPNFRTVLERGILWSAGKL